MDFNLLRNNFLLKSLLQQKISMATFILDMLIIIIKCECVFGASTLNGFLWSFPLYVSTILWLFNCASFYLHFLFLGLFSFSLLLLFFCFLANSESIKHNTSCVIVQNFFYFISSIYMHTLQRLYMHRDLLNTVYQWWARCSSSSD